MPDQVADLLTDGLAGGSPAEMLTGGLVTETSSGSGGAYLGMFSEPPKDWIKVDVGATGDARTLPLDKDFPEDVFRYMLGLIVVSGGAVAVINRHNQQLNLPSATPALYMLPGHFSRISSAGIGATEIWVAMSRVVM